VENRGRLGGARGETFSLAPVHLRAATKGIVLRPPGSINAAFVAGLDKPDCAPKLLFNIVR
jgi:hypothetical protein